MNVVQELEAIFEVIGSPEWSCIEAVESEAWRRFLWQVPNTAPHLHRRFGFAGEPAVDLLRRLLAFDPNRRYLLHFATLATSFQQCYAWNSLPSSGYAQFYTSFNCCSVDSMPRHYY